MSNQHKDQLSGHNYDGIQEFDNPLPGWWVHLFWITIVWSVGYAVYFHLGGPGLGVHEEYALEMKVFNEAEAERLMAMGTVDQATLEGLMADATTVEKGHQLYIEKCASCHGDSAEGKIGPNLTDAYWIHGSGLIHIYNTVDQGVPDKGMVAWGRVLSREELLAVVSYVGTVRGSNVPGKAPEGEKVDELAVR